MKADTGPKRGEPNAPLIRPTYVTESMFLTLPESMSKVELIDGEVFLGSTPSVEHQRIVARLGAALHAWSRANPPYEAFLGPLDIRFGEDRILQTDLVVFSEAVDRSAGPIRQCPTLCIEVLSGSNRSHDLVTKRFVYAAAGVPEYWIIDPNGSVERWRGDGLSEGAAVVDALSSPLLPGFELPIDALFR